MLNTVTDSFYLCLLHLASAYPQNGTHLHIKRCYGFFNFFEKVYDLYYWSPTYYIYLTLTHKTGSLYILQCNELNRGHPRFFSQSQDEFRTKESEFVHFGPNTNERSNLTGNWCERMWKWIVTLLFTAKCCSFSSPVDQMWASNAKDEFNANMLTEWYPGRVKPVNQ